MIPNWTGFGTGGSAGMIHNDSTSRSQSSDSLLYRNTASFAYHHTRAQRPFAEIKTIGVRTENVIKLTFNIACFLQLLTMFYTVQNKLMFNLEYLVYLRQVESFFALHFVDTIFFVVH